MFGAMTALIGFVDYLVLADLQEIGNVELLVAHAHSALSLYLIIAFIHTDRAPAFRDKAFQMG